LIHLAVDLKADWSQSNGQKVVGFFPTCIVIGVAVFSFAVGFAAFGAFFWGAVFLPVSVFFSIAIVVFLVIDFELTYVLTHSSSRAKVKYCRGLPMKRDFLSGFFDRFEKKKMQ
jgi:hypothetical protein